MYTLSERLTLPKFSPWRTLYAVHQNGVLFCFLGYRNGWGKGWEFYPLTMHSLSGVNVEGMGPNSNKSMRYYGEGRAPEALAALEAGHVKLNNGYFIDANAIRTAATAATEKANKVLTDSIARMMRDKADHEKRAATLQTMRDSFPWEQYEQETLTLASLHYQGAAKALQGSIEFAQQKLSEG